MKKRIELAYHTRWSREGERVLDLIRAVQRVLGITNRELEARLGMSTNYLSRIFSGKIALRFDHVLALATGLGLRWDEFFRAAYPSTGESSSAAAREIQALLGHSAEVQGERSQ